ncbi:hypothetical protein CBR_g22906 [Chara braunii]|uniref:Integrase catalytic domain-containing protein n=1 Tax=Chara braunii TaxID=69332 RepID=A0A388L355_CHABU|nr:hypothetical protein CBR_g22906 [Chara braunii]|eukprot:GBG76688.1 hypothetical protein CBR_g22906 [Chara braunii]
MPQLRDYLHSAVPTPLMDAGVAVVDLHVFIAKINREFKTQRYDDIDAPLLYIRIQIGEATCSALIDCGASRNYISQDFMKDWVDRLPDIEFAYNTSVHPAIGVTPFEFHHGGRKGRIFADLLLPRPADIDAVCSPSSVRKYRELLTQARANMQKAQVRMQQQANRHRVPCPIRAGDLVWVSAEEFALEQDVSRKLLPKWFGPWSVTAATGDEPNGPPFVINIPEHLTVHPIFHASKAKSDDFPDRRSQDPPMDGHQEVDRVISDHKYGSKPR